MRYLLKPSVFYLVLGAGVLLCGGCIDLTQSPERECLEERRCAPGEASVCGADGVEYGCASMAACFGAGVDPSGEACGDTLEPPECPAIDCTESCPDGYQVDDDGCETCECAPSSCAFTSCEEEPGAEPCPDGTSPTNVGSDEDGCPRCDCRPAQCEIDGGDEACIATHCGNPRARCHPADEGVLCPGAEPPYREPAPQCVCSASECDERACTTDGDCEGPDGLCVDQSHCVGATCSDFVDEHDQTAERHDTCGSDADCVIYAAVHQCCTAYALNREGERYLNELDEVLRQTSCGEDFAENCAMVDCQPLPTEPEHSICVDGRCEYAP